MVESRTAATRIGRRNLVKSVVKELPRWPTDPCDISESMCRLSHGGSESPLSHVVDESDELAESVGQLVLLFGVFGTLVLADVLHEETGQQGCPGRDAHLEAINAQGDREAPCRERHERAPNPQQAHARILEVNRHRTHTGPQKRSRHASPPPL